MDVPKTLIVLGVFLVVAGCLAWGLQRFPLTYSWFGNLPGDLRYEGKGAFIYAPIVSMLIVSVLLSGIGYLIRRFWP